MRAILAAMLLAAGVGLAGAPTVSAAPVTPGVIGDAANTMTSIEPVHCRAYRHRSRSHRFGTGCYRGGTVYLGPRVYRGYRGGWRGGRTGYRSGRSGFRGGAVIRGGGRSGMRGGMQRGGGRGGMRSGGGMRGGGAMRGGSGGGGGRSGTVQGGR